MARELGRMGAEIDTTARQARNEPRINDDVDSSLDQVHHDW